jgi:hypothetical protein
MRLLGGLGLLAPVAFLVVLFAAPAALVSWVDDGSRSILVAVGAAAIGVWLTAIITLVYVMLRYRRLAGATALGVGADLVDPQALAAGQAGEITRKAREFVDLVKAARA